MGAKDGPLNEETIAAWRTEGLLDDVSSFRGQQRLIVPRSSLRRTAGRLRDELRFDMLIDVTCVDYLAHPRRHEVAERFGLVYQLLRTEDVARLTLRVFVGETAPCVESLVPLWESANWLEREVWDLFGIRFEGHPDLRRILLPEPFRAHPLRKDYPLQGLGERHNFPVLRRGEG